MGTTIRRGARCKRGLQSPGREFESPPCLSSGWASHLAFTEQSDAISQPLDYGFIVSVGVESGCNPDAVAL